MNKYLSWSLFTVSLISLLSIAFVLVVENKITDDEMVFMCFCGFLFLLLTFIYGRITSLQETNNI